MKKYEVKRKEKRFQARKPKPCKNVQKFLDDYKEMSSKKKAILIPHPTQPNCWIEKLVDE